MTLTLGGHEREIDVRKSDAHVARTPRWRAFAVALALHGALALLFCLSLRAAEADEDGGASVIEIEVEMAAPKVETADAAPGPESEAAAATPDSALQQAKNEPSDKPKDEPAPVESAEIIAAREEETKPVRETPAAAVAQSAAVASTASQDSAPPVLQAALAAPTARAPQIGAGPSDARENATWRKRLAAHLARYKSWPAGAGRRSVEVDVRFRLERSGAIALAEIVRSSGLPAFDAAALAMLRRADPAPAPPSHVADDALTFTVPVVFTTRDRSK